MDGQTSIGFSRKQKEFFFLFFHPTFKRAVWFLWLELKMKKHEASWSGNGGGWGVRCTTLQEEPLLSFRAQRRRHQGCHCHQGCCSVFWGEKKSLRQRDLWPLAEAFRRSRSESPRPGLLVCIRELFKVIENHKSPPFIPDRAHVALQHRSLCVRFPFMSHPQTDRHP